MSPVKQPDRYAYISLIQLPNEIHNLIIELLEIESVFLLGLSCWHFWVLARPVIAEHFAGYLGLWAGTPVICVGDESHRDGKYPDGLRSSEDLDELANGLEVEELEDGLAESSAEIPVNLYDLANARYTSITEVTTGFPHGLFVLALDLRHNWGSPADITRVVNPEPSSFYPCRRNGYSEI
ncbi:putative F-box domain-containing protein [Histoplasma ohiense]|nr:putative F-box domain-containing protein [Histoplasma ohiense (nom. inval.)]